MAMRSRILDVQGLSQGTVEAQEALQSSRAQGDETEKVGNDAQLLLHSRQQGLEAAGAASRVGTAMRDMASSKGV